MKNIACLMLLALLPWGCSTTSSSVTPLETAALGTTQIVHRSGKLYLASQPAPEDFALLHKAGIRTVINLRDPKEQPDFDEAARARELGLAYHNPVIAGADGMTDERLSEVRRLLRESEGPLLLHCASSNRVGAVWMVYRVLDEGAAPESAAAEAAQAGLKSEALKTRALDYIRRHRTNR